MDNWFTKEGFSLEIKDLRDKYLKLPTCWPVIIILLWPVIIIAGITLTIIDIIKGEA